LHVNFEEFSAKKNEDIAGRGGKKKVGKTKIALLD
jgi:hypothetical protein